MRPLEAMDTDDLYSIYSDPNVMKYWNFLPWSDPDCAREFIIKDNEALQFGDYLRLGIEMKTTRRLIGACSLFSFNKQCMRAELGYLLAKRYWGQGFMHEALVGLLDYAFNVLALNRIEADIDPRNVASAKVLIRLGFQKEGHLRERWIVNDEVSDSDLFGLLRHDWNSIMPGNDQSHQT